MTFEVVDGGGGRGRPPGSGDKKKRKSRFKPHVLAQPLFDAVGSTGLPTLGAIATQMSSAVGYEVTAVKVREVIRHVRTYSDRYDWTIPHAQKGPRGKNRKYLVGLLDKNHPGLMVTTADFDGNSDAVNSGLISLLRNVVTECTRGATGTYSFANYKNHSDSERRELLAAASGMDATAAMAKTILGRLNTA